MCIESYDEESGESINLECAEAEKKDKALQGALEFVKAVGNILYGVKDFDDMEIENNLEEALHYLGESFPEEWVTIQVRPYFSQDYKQIAEGLIRQKAEDML
jgi:hypothetical protein